MESGGFINCRSQWNQWCSHWWNPVWYYNWVILLCVVTLSDSSRYLSVQIHWKISQSSAPQPLRMMPPTTVAYTVIHLTWHRQGCGLKVPVLTIMSLLDKWRGGWEEGRECRYPARLHTTSCEDKTRGYRRGRRRGWFRTASQKHVRTSLNTGSSKISMLARIYLVMLK